MFGLQGPEAYAYTSASNCLEVSDIDDTKDYHDTIVGLSLSYEFVILFVDRKLWKLSV